MKAELGDLSGKLKDLHKELLVFQARLVEQEDGRKYGPYDLLHLSIHDSRFAWIGELSGLITRIDAYAFDADVAEPDLDSIVDEVEKLLGGTRGGFARSYQSARHAQPHLTVSEVEVKRALAQLKPFLNSP